MVRGFQEDPEREKKRKDVKVLFGSMRHLDVPCVISFLAHEWEIIFSLSHDEVRICCHLFYNLFSHLLSGFFFVSEASVFMKSKVKSKLINFITAFINYYCTVTLPTHLLFLCSFDLFFN